MDVVSFTSLHLARFDSVTALLEYATQPVAGDAVAWLVGDDDEEAGIGLGSMRAPSWVAIGLHSDVESARASYAAGWRGLPGAADAADSRAGLLQPTGRLAGSGNQPGVLVVGPCVTPADRGTVLADLETSSHPALLSARDILDEVEFGARVAESFAAASTPEQDSGRRQTG